MPRRAPLSRHQFPISEVVDYCAAAWPVFTPPLTVPLAPGDTVELQGYFRAADGYFAADHTTFWGGKVG